MVQCFAYDGPILCIVSGIGWAIYVEPPDKQNCETCFIGQWLMCMSIEMRNQSDIVTF